MKNTERFTNKADNYAKYRPSYPAELFEYLHTSIGVNKASVVADIGAGTGIFTKLMAPIAGKVFAVEPNDKMRSACIKHCTGLGNIIYSNGSAEDTKLEDRCLDYITVAQAFHWFDKDRTRVEFKRILKPEGRLVLVWNRKGPDTELTVETQEVFRRFCPEFKGFAGGVPNEEERDLSIFKDGCEHRVFNNDRFETLEGFIGGNLSASCAPNPEDDNYGEFVVCLTRLFDKYGSDGKLLITNSTHSYAGVI